MVPPVVDVSSAANFHAVACKHISLDFALDFDKKMCSGTVTITLDRKDPFCGEVVLDVHEIEVTSCRFAGEESDSPYVIKPFSPFGSALHVILPATADTELKLTLGFRAGETPGVCWLTPAQTAGKRKPFVYTQGQACLNRSWFPCQDTPALKITFAATARVREGFTVVMSGLPATGGDPVATETGLVGPVTNSEGEWIEFKYAQSVPIPVYLVAMAAGDLACSRIGPRSLVWAEPEVLPSAQAEFSDVTEQYLSIAEGLFGPYVWGRYDLLVMPPSFPYGGMENPNLTFVTPTLIAGDKSLTDTIMHEISHSWFGNLVTNATWNDFWLNEGFTTYAQRRICALANSPEVACLEAMSGINLLRKDVETMGADSPFTRLHIPLEPNVDPDDTYCYTPYEKGFCFLSYLANEVGVERFDDFLKSYVQHFLHQSITHHQSLEYFFETFPELREKLMFAPGKTIQQWLHTPGNPCFVPDFSAAAVLYGPPADLAAGWISGDAHDKPAPQGWSTYQYVYFLDKLLDAPPLAVEVVNKLDATFQLSASNNAEVRFRWSWLIIKSGDSERFDVVRSFLRAQGKQKFTIPLYQAMAKHAVDLGKEMFAETFDALNVAVSNRVSKILGQ